MDKTDAAIGSALRSAKLAYQFCAGSYTYDAMLALLKARELIGSESECWGCPMGEMKAPDER